MTDIPTLTPLPAVPQRGQDPAVFVQRADAFIDALVAFVAEMNAFGAELIDATNERVVNEAAASFQGALDAKNLAIAARNAAQAAAASIDPDNLVHRSGVETITGKKNFTGGLDLAGVALDPVQRSGDQSVDGIKTFVKKVLASAGIRINNVDLTALTTAGKNLIEAASVDDQRTILGIGVEAAGGVGALVAAASTAFAASTLIAFGTTVAGSSLVTAVPAGNPISLGGYTSGSSSGATPGVNPTNNNALGLSGTWRLQTTIRTMASGDLLPVGLWKRIA